ncbi:hypothetical protein [Niveibacterium sp. SC-1]|uniref:hypothetical protein n=1 Tax=Niveibacterium sp. SC-1 TaxID=3135646 RepID=UPI00311EB808
MALFGISMIRLDAAGRSPSLLEVRPVLQISSDGEDFLLGPPELLDPFALGDRAEGGDTFFVVRPGGGGFHPVATVRRSPEAGGALASFDAEARPTGHLLELPRF